MITDDIIEHSEANALKRNPWERYRGRAPFPTAKRLDLPFSEVLHCALEQSKHVTMNYGILGGTPCITKTRIPVSMILDAIEYHGSLAGARKSYPQLTMEQIHDAVLFAAGVLECPCGK